MSISGSLMTPHAVLGLHFNATKEDVVSAFRRLAKSCHPDLHPGDPEAAERFRALNVAYRSLIADFEAQGGRRRATHTAAPTRVTARRNVFLTVHEAMTGCRKPIEGISGPCPACTGAGRVPSPGPVECPSCVGTGISQRRQSGFINLRTECSDCSGKGKITWFICHECSGSGSVHMERCDVDIPPGSRSGDHLVVPGGANNPKENVVGDLEITVVIKDSRFSMSGNDIETSVSVDLWETVFGTTVGVALPSGEVCRLVVPPETPPGRRFRISGRGLNYTEEKGDLIVSVRARPLKLADPGVKEAMTLLKSASSRS